MSIHHDRVLSNSYDVIVIGAGLGGLTTASLLAKRGVNVLVIEQHTIPGGACTSFRREDRSYDCGAALIFGLGTSGYNLISTLLNLLEEPITVIPREKFFRLDFAGQRINFWKDLNKFIPELSAQFPEEKKEIQNLYNELLKSYSRYLEGRNIVTPPTEMSDREKMEMLRDPIRVIKLQRLLKQSAQQYMGKHIKSQKLLNFYDKLCASYAYITMKETPAIMALTMFTDNHIGGTHYVAGGAQTYSNTLERSIEKNKGTIIYNRKVEQILFNDNKANGVKLSDGHEIYAERVVSDTTVWNLYNKLIPREQVTEGQLNWANSLISTYPAMVLYASVSKSVFPPDINPVEYYISDPENIDMNDITLYIPSFDDASLGPPDEHIITIFSPSPDTKWPHPWTPEYQTPEYQEQKQRQADLIIQEIEKRIPGFRNGIKNLIIATPSTIERYTLKNNGCVGGPKQMIGQEIGNRLHAQTDWMNLYACGDSTTMGMGMPAVTASGFGAANIILRDLEKQEYTVKEVKQNFVKYIASQPPLKIPEEILENPENASLLARMCQHCEKQLCRSACPTNSDIAGFLRRIEAENYTGAAKLIRETNPFPETCGLFCDSGEMCERECIRNEYGKPVKIRELSQWVAKHTGRHGWAHTVAELNGKSILVFGAGPAGLSCAYYLARLGYNIDLMDKHAEPGFELYNYLKQHDMDSEELRRDIDGIMLPNITYIGVQDFTSIPSKGLGEYEACYLSTRIKEEFMKTFSTVPLLYVAEKIYDPNNPDYGIAQAIAEGRKQAEIIHRSVREGTASR